MASPSPELNQEQKYLIQSQEIIKHWQGKGMKFGRYVNGEVCFLEVSSDGRCFPLDSEHALKEIAKCVQKGQNFHLDK